MDPELPVEKPADETKPEKGGFSWEGVILIGFGLICLAVPLGFVCYNLFFNQDKIRAEMNVASTGIELYTKAQTLDHNGVYPDPQQAIEQLRASAPKFRFRTVDVVPVATGRSKQVLVSNDGQAGRLHLVVVQGNDRVEALLQGSHTLLLDGDTNEKE